MGTESPAPVAMRRLQPLLGAACATCGAVHLAVAPGEGSAWIVDGITLAAIGADIRLSSAPGQTASPATAHADFINGWSQSTLGSIVAGCITAHLHCNAQGTITPRASPERTGGV